MQPDIARDQWLAERRKSVGASEIAALFNCHRYHSPYSLWALKRGELIEDAEMEEAAKWGQRLEPAIATGYAEDYGVELFDPGRYQIARHPSYDFISCTYDRLIVMPEERVPLEIKLPSDFKWYEWEEDDAPLYMHLQVMQQIAISGASHGVLFALVGGQRPRRIEIQRDEELIEIIINAAFDFIRLVETGTPPRVDEHPSTTAALKRIVADGSKVINLPRAAMRWDDQVRRSNKIIERAEAIRDRNKNRIRAALGTAETGILPGGDLWNWKPNKKGERALKRSR